jgi:hypothetical protein
MQKSFLAVAVCLMLSALVVAVPVAYAYTFGFSFPYTAFNVAYAEAWYETFTTEFDLWEVSITNCMTGTNSSVIARVMLVHDANTEFSVNMKADLTFDLYRKYDNSTSTQVLNGTWVSGEALLLTFDGTKLSVGDSGNYQEFASDYVVGAYNLTRAGAYGGALAFTAGYCSVNIVRSSINATGILTSITSILPTLVTLSVVGVLVGAVTTIGAKKARSRGYSRRRRR